MKSTAAKRILSLIIALAMMIAPMTVHVTAAQGGQLEDGGVVASAKETYELIPDPSGLEPYEPVLPLTRGWPGEEPDLSTLTKRESGSPAISASLRGGSKAVGDQQFFYDALNGGSYTATVRAVTAHSVIYVQNDTANSGAVAFATTVGNAFEAEIYDLVTDLVGEPYLADYGFGDTPSFAGEKINIVLTDINATNTGSGYTGGYFYSGDFIVNDGQNMSNEGPIIYVDVTPGYGGRYIAIEGGLEILGTVAHEFQHLINFSYILKNFNSLSTSDGSYTRNTWLNEGLAGVVDAKFLAMNDKKMSMHLNAFLADLFAPSTGYVPTDAQWQAANPTNYIYALYGSTSLLMQEFVKSIGNAKSLVDNPYVGYANSLTQVATYSGKGSFNAFFEDAVLKTSVDSGSWESAVGLDSGTPGGQNLWLERYNLAVEASQDGFMGVTDLLTGTTGSVSYNSGGRTYYSKMYHYETVGTANQYVSFTVPANARATYYLISAADPTDAVRTDVAWVTADKTATKIVSGEKYDVGVGNGFVVLAMNTSAAVSESIGYTIIEADRPQLTVTASPNATYVFGNNGMTLPFTATVPDDGNSYNGVVLVVEGVDAAGNVVPGILGDNATVSGTSASGTVTIANTVPAGVYKLRVQDGTDPEGLLGTSNEFTVRLKLSLGQSGATINPVTPPDLTINVGGGPAISGTGNFYATVGGVTYTATVTVADPASSISIPFTSFRNGGSSLLVGYDKTVTVTTEEGSMVTADGATSITTALGQFTTVEEPSDPSIIPGTININKDEASSANMLVYFGAGSDYTVAKITSANEAIASVSPAEVTVSGSAVTVTAGSLGTTTLTIGFSGNDSAGEPVNEDKTVTVNVTGNSSYTPIGPGFIGGGDTGSGTGSGSSSSGGGGGGGGGSVNPFSALDSAKAAKETASAIAKAVAAGSENATVRFVNIKEMSLDAMKDMAAQAKKAGITLKVNVDTVVNGKIIMRQSFYPADATKSVQFGGSTTSGRAVAAKTLFKKYYSNSVEVFALHQKEDFGMNVHTAIFTSLTKENAAVYSYDASKNQFKQILDSKMFKDKNGYLQFDTSLAYNLVLSEGKLAKK